MQMNAVCTYKGDLICQEELDRHLASSLLSTAPLRLELTFPVLFSFDVVQGHHIAR